MEKRLYRSNNRMISGVCAGLAEYFNIDPVVVRAIFLGLIFAGGSGFIIYIILLIIVPERPKFDNYVEVDDKGEATVVDDKQPTVENVNTESKAEKKERIKSTCCSENTRKSAAIIAGVFFIFFGLFFLFRNFIPFLHFKYLFPSFLVLLGIFLLIFSNKQKS